jgi:hypothetical protein
LYLPHYRRANSGAVQSKVQIKLTGALINAAGSDRDRII